MKRTPTVITVASIALTLFIFLLSGEIAPPLQVPDGLGVVTKHAPVPLAISSKSNKRGRADYAWRRLHDPRTKNIPRSIHHKELAFAKTLPKPTTSKNARELQSLAEWTARGPVNIGGRSRALVFDATNSSRIIAGAVSGGIWISENTGQTWRRSNDLTEPPQVTCVAQDPRDGHTQNWYFGSGEYTGSSARSVNSRVPHYNGEGIYKSTNNGETWNILPSTTDAVNELGTPFDVVFELAVNPVNTTQDEIWAATYATIQRSLDGGETWETMLGSFVPDVASAYTHVFISPNGVIYAMLASFCEDAGIWRSTNSGETWTNITPTDIGPEYHRIIGCYSPTDESILYFIGQTPGTGHFNDSGEYSLWRLDMDGNSPTWANRSANMPDLSEYSQLPFGGTYNSQGGYNICIAVHPDNPEMVFLGGTSLFRSTDGFSTTDNTNWIGGYNYYYYRIDPLPNQMPSCYPNHHPDVHKIVFSPTQHNLIFTTHDGGISSCAQSDFVVSDTEPMPWTLHEGYPTTQFYSVALNPDGSGDPSILGGMQDNGSYVSISENPETAWFMLTGGDGMQCDISIANDSGQHLLYTSVQYGGSFYSFIVNNNYEIEGFYRIEVNDAEFDLWITPFAVSPTNAGTLYLLDDNSVFRNPDVFSNPDNFALIPETEVAGGNASAIGVSKTPADVVYYGVSNIEGQTQNRIYRIDDAIGALPSVSDITPTDAPFSGWVHSIVVDPTDAEKALVVITNYNVQSLFYTEDGGTTWTAVGGNLEENEDGTGNGPSCFCAEILYKNGIPVYFVGTTVGLFVTTELDGANTIWTQESPDMIGNVWVTSLDGRDSDDFLAVGTHGYGVFSGTVGDVLVREDAPSLPRSHHLASAYPNPFNSQAKIEFTLAYDDFVSVDVFNILGRNVATLHKGELSVGTHPFVLNADQLASGQYLIRVKTNSGFEASQKITLLR